MSVSQQKAAASQKNGVDMSQFPFGKLSVSLLECVDRGQCSYGKVMTAIVSASIPKSVARDQCSYGKVITAIVSMFLPRGVDRCQCLYRKLLTGVSVPTER